MDTTESLIEFLKKSIELGNQEKSKLHPKTFNVPGFTSPKIRHFLNNLGELPNLHYLEVGVHKGATFVAANYENKPLSSVAIDNWCEFPEEGYSKQEFLRYTKELLVPNSFKIYEQDCFTITKEQLQSPINCYLYDGCHSYESQMKSLTYFYPLLDDTFIFLVDDWNWDDPKRGTRQAIADLNLNILYERELGEGWWNGFFVSLLKK